MFEGEEANEDFFPFIHSSIHSIIPLFSCFCNVLNNIETFTPCVEKVLVYFSFNPTNNTNDPKLLGKWITTYLSINLSMFLYYYYFPHILFATSLTEVSSLLFIPLLLILLIHVLYSCFIDWWCLGWYIVFVCSLSDPIKIFSFRSSRNQT